jgi:hypothetical protein
VKVSIAQCEWLSARAAHCISVKHQLRYVLRTAAQRCATVAMHSVPRLLLSLISWLTFYVAPSLMAALLLVTQNTGKKTLRIIKGLMNVSLISQKRKSGYIL